MRTLRRIDRYYLIFTVLLLRLMKKNFGKADEKKI